jgi:F0F1-type ATP synthase assembly protein I
MGSNKSSSKSKKSKAKNKGKKVERFERRFVPERSNAAMFTMVGAMIGGLAVGAGVYGQWFLDPRVAQAPWLVAGGAVVLAAVILWGDMQGVIVRVGDGGVALEESSGTRRLAWCDMKEVVLKDGVFRLKGKDKSLVFKVGANPLGAAWVLREAEQRIAKRLQAEKAERQALVDTKSNDGERMEVEPLQVTGRLCRASERVLTFERDARFCLRCGEVYHQEELPERCLTCEQELSEDQVVAG